MALQIYYLIPSRKLLINENKSTTKLAKNDFLVLQHLVNEYPLEVDKDTLLENGWPGRIVTNSSLKVSIHKLRRILNEELNLSVDILYVRDKGYVLSKKITVKELLNTEHKINKENVEVTTSSSKSAPYQMLISILSILASVLLIVFYYSIGLI